MQLIQEIEINKFGQNLIDIKDLVTPFSLFEHNEKKKYLTDILFLILQSKPVDADIEPAIELSMLRKTFTPCVMIKKGVATYNLKKLLELPENELNKSLILLLSLFKIAYQRRFKTEKKDPYKWWYSDLSDDKNVEAVLKKYNY